MRRERRKKRERRGEREEGRETNRCTHTHYVAILSTFTIGKDCLVHFTYRNMEVT